VIVIEIQSIDKGGTGDQLVGATGNVGGALVDQLVINEIKKALTDAGVQANVYHADSAPGPSSAVLLGAAGLVVGGAIGYFLEK
jgi:hypothetical protein